MFWGLTLEAGKKYGQQVEASFHISMAALDCRGQSEELLTVTVGVEKNEYILCNLSKSNTQQQALDLNFFKGDEIYFRLKGKGVVHLTGYIIPEDDDFSGEEDSDDEEAPQLMAAKLGEFDANKRKGITNGKNEPSAKKLKGVPVATNGGDDSEEDEDEEDAEEEEDSDMEDNPFFDSVEEEEEEDDEEEEDESEEEEAAPQLSPKQMKQLQKQQQQNQKTPPTKKNSLNGAATPKDQSAKKGEKAQTPKQMPKDAKNSGTPGAKKTLHGGVVVEDLVVGSGPLAASGKQAAVYYVGRNKQNNKQFDATQSGPPFKFRLGKGDVIKGWDIGVQGMKVGGKRRVICPPHMAYGNRGSPPVIPPNSTLVFDIELKGVS